MRKFVKIICIPLALALVICFSLLFAHKLDKAPIIQQLVDRQIELEVIVAKNADTIKIQETLLLKADEAYNELVQVSIALKGENYVMVKAMKEMLEYIGKLESVLRQMQEQRSENRDANLYKT
jgi:hypothetical protein